MKKMIRTDKQFWILADAKSYHGDCPGTGGAYAIIQGICKTEQQARILKEQNPDLRTCSISRSYLYEEVEVEDEKQELVPGTIYLDKGRKVEFSRMTSDGVFAIVHPPGEPDMQSCYGIPPSRLEPVLEGR